jgi:hypothetical protein
MATVIFTPLLLRLFQRASREGVSEDHKKTLQPPLVPEQWKKKYRAREWICRERTAREREYWREFGAFDNHARECVWINGMKLTLRKEKENEN